MLLLAAAALVASPPPPRLAAVAQAAATIRVVSAVRLKLDGSPNADAPAPRPTVLRFTDGTNRLVKLIEFQ
jgi:hypothetical protein